MHATYHMPSATPTNDCGSVPRSGDLNRTKLAIYSTEATRSADSTYIR